MPFGITDDIVVFPAVLLRSGSCKLSLFETAPCGITSVVCSRFAIHLRRHALHPSSAAGLPDGTKKRRTLHRAVSEVRQYTRKSARTEYAHGDSVPDFLRIRNWRFLIQSPVEPGIKSAVVSSVYVFSPLSCKNWVGD